MNPPDSLIQVSPAQQLRIPGRGTSWVRDVAGPPGAPTVVLLHGLGATAAINWPGAPEFLSRNFRVITLDQRGHGRGIRSPWPFRLEDCADDVVALADVFGVERFVAVGYSMGGPIAMLTRRRHPERVSGLVLSATSARFSDDTSASPMVAAMAVSLRMVPSPLRRQLAASMTDYAARRWKVPPAMVEEVRRHDPAAIVEAARAVRRFDATAWVGDLNCPAVSIVTTNDGLVPAGTQLQLAHAIGATVYRIPGDHAVPGRDPQTFLPALDHACRTVTARQAITYISPSRQTG